ncbi:nucleoside/nucleotide kinase family protein [Nereida ignava]|uniref:nucleoside/nucleotide kinase family protein n=1 Tax=Nereida ignava TaxID=282199 RepID=UPI0030F99C93
MDKTADYFAEIVTRRAAGLSSSRKIIAISGPPASGKSTVAEAVVASLTTMEKTAALVPMDGFHLDNAVLERAGTLARKGAPETFDADGFVHLISRIANGTEAVYAPVFDRARDITVAGAQLIPTNAEFVIVEGNYLMLNAAPWDQLRQFWTLSVAISAPMDVVEQRLMERWTDYDIAPDEARAKVQGNDLKNAKMVLQNSAPSDLILG